jgi:uncharacterized protein YjdB/uncharacterized protein YkwD
MKKMFIFGLLAGLLTFSASGVSAAEVPLPDLTDVDTSPVIESTENVLSTAGMMVYPDSYPDGFNMYVTDAVVNATSANDMLTYLNALRAEKGLSQLVLDGQLTKTAMHRASEICNVYRHKDPAGLWAQSEYVRFDGGTENIVIGAGSGSDAFYAFKNSGLHLCQMLSPLSTRVGIGNYGSAWVLSFGNDNVYKGWDLTQSELQAYNTPSRVAKTVVDGNTYDISFVIDSNHSSTKSVTLDRGVSKQLEGYIVPDPITIFTSDYADVRTKIVPSTISWTSSNPSVASVDSNGVVSGKTAGTATITGTLYADTITYNVTVTGNGTAPEQPLTDYLVKYRTHVQNVGWQSYVADGSMSGTSGRSLRLEGINIDLNDNISGGVEYRTHVQNIGWQNYVANGAMSGTEGMSYRLEGIQIRLTGEAATKYDIYYRVHTQNIGWMGWAKNGEQSGSAGYSYRLEGIEVKVVPKGSPAPGSTVNAFVQK